MLSAPLLQLTLWRGGPGLRVTDRWNKMAEGRQQAKKVSETRKLGPDHIIQYQVLCYSLIF